MNKHLMTGNEAIARGAYEAGVRVCSAYPGTPSTEIFENLPLYKDSLYCEWAPNEKVAAEVAYGASIAGVRSLCAMKHVGVLGWRIPWTEEPGGLWSCKKLDWSDLA